MTNAALKASVIGFILALLHLVGFFVTVHHVITSPVEQSTMIWLVWFPVDFPWSLLNLLGGEGYSNWVQHISETSEIMGYILYTPYLVHGLIGTVWWFFIPHLIRKFLKSRESRRESRGQNDPPSISRTPR